MLTSDADESVDYETLLLPYQQQFFADNSEVKVCEKSRQIGITWTAGAEGVMYCVTDTLHCYYIGYKEDLAEQFVRECGEWAVHLGMAASEMEVFFFNDVDEETGEPKRSIKAFRIVFANGRRIVGLTSAPRNLRGLKHGYLILDEFAFHDDPFGLLKASMALLIWGSRIAIISTHNGIDNPFNQLVEDIRAGKAPYTLHRYTFNRAVADGLCRRVFLRSGRTWSPEAEDQWVRGIRAKYRDAAEEELDCVPSKGGVAYFDRDVVESRMVKGRAVLRLYLSREFTSRPEREREKYVGDWLLAEVAPRLTKLPRDRQHFLGQDFGRTADLSVMAPGTLLEDLTRDVPFLIELGNVPFEQQKQIAFFVLDKLPRFTRAHFDATGNGAYLAEVCAQKYGDTRIEQVKITENWHLQTWPPLRAAFEEDKIRLPSDEEVRADFTAVKRVQGIPKLPSAVVLKVDEGDGARTIRRHGDAAVACAMLYAATRGLEGAINRGEQWKRAVMGM
jgi:phage FluMu gp28-like protein